jgi:hypothetical protein
MDLYVRGYYDLLKERVSTVLVSEGPIPIANGAEPIATQRREDSRSFALRLSLDVDYYETNRLTGIARAIRNWDCERSGASLLFVNGLEYIGGQAHQATLEELA